MHGMNATEHRGLIQYAALLTTGCLHARNTPMRRALTAAVLILEILQ